MQCFAFAAAKDGDLLLSCCDAENIDEARDIALGMIADWLGIEGPVYEDEIAGFAISSLEGLGQ